jgi:hypothetical protein
MELNGGVASPNSRTAEHERDRASVLFCFLYLPGI